MRLATPSLALLVLSLSRVGDGAEGPALPFVTNVEQQPLVSQVERLVQSLEERPWDWLFRTPGD